jgi:replication-associated recombination protein RarA
MGSLADQYRPTGWTEIVGQEKAVKVLQRIADGRKLGRAIWISGGTGTGKTTIARVMATEVADPMCIEEIDAGRLTPSRVRDIWAGFQLYGPGKGGRVLIVNEAHALSKETIYSLLVELERIPSHCLVIFTTTVDGLNKFTEAQLDAEPLLHRCLPVQLARRGLSEPFAARLMDIGQREGLTAESVTIQDCVKVLQSCHNSMRGALMALESGALL